MHHVLRTATFGLAITIAGCQAPPATSPVATRHDPAAQAALASVRKAFDAGDFGAVIRTVATSSSLHEAAPDIRIQAYKLQAFSYCMNGYALLCRDTFSRILALDPGFSLAAAEAGHPQWGPVFEQARGQ